MNGNAEKESCNDDFLLILSLRQTDPFYDKKKKLLHARDFNPEVQVLFTRLSASLNDTLKALVEAARIIHLDEDELYFAGVNANHPENIYSPRNELEALNSILSLINISLNNATHKKMDILEFLRDATLDMIREFGERHGEELLIEKRACLAEDLLLQWAKDHGLKTKLQIAYFNGAGRGALAVNDLKVGDTALEIPVSIIISEEVVYESEMVAMGLEDVRVHISFYWRRACSASIDIHLRQKINTLNPLKNIVLKIKSGFHILKELDGLTPETMLLLWSMMERYNSESKFKIFFETLPETFNTGLSFGIEALTALEGTLLFEEIIQAKEHLRMQYDALCPLLCNKHPDMFQPDLYTWDRFLWACELWYSNSMKVVFPDGKLKTCLVPVAGFLNHSLCPHIIRYGRVDSASKALKFSLSRPCREGEQCYLSYGNFSSSHLITFYGFMPKGENIYDVIPLDIDAPHTDDFGNCHDSEWTAHMVRGTWLSSNHELFNYGLPPPLLNYLRATLNDSKMPMETFVDTENEKAVLETLCSIFNPMLEGLGVSVNGQRENLEWDVKLALDFKDLQIRIISSVLASCSAGLEMLQCLELKETMNAAATTSEDS